MDAFPDDFTLEKLLPKAREAQARKEAEALRLARKRVYDDITQAVEDGSPSAVIGSDTLAISFEGKRTLLAEISSRFPTARCYGARTANEPLTSVDAAFADAWRVLL
jgi:hypothetical protein